MIRPTSSYLLDGFIIHNIRPMDDLCVAVISCNYENPVVQIWYNLVLKRNKKSLEVFKQKIFDIFHMVALLFVLVTKEVIL